MAKKAVALEDLSIVKDYIDSKASATLVTVDGKISTHNSDQTAHNDIRTAVSNAADSATSAQEQASDAKQKAAKAETDAANAQAAAEAADSKASAAQGTASAAASTASAAQTAANEAKSIAEGRARAVSFATVEAMTTALKGASASEYKVGDNLFIEAVGVPDYWIKSVLSNNAGAYGYYEIAELETRKVDLTDYATNQGVTDAIGVHNASSAAHQDIRTELEGKASKTAATEITAGLMSAADKQKLNKIEAEANKTVVDTEINSSSANPVQNKAVAAMFQTVDSELNKKATPSDVTNQISSHNASSTAHGDIRTAVAAKADKKAATTTTDGLMSAEDKTKLDAIPAAAKIVTTDTAQTIGGAKTFEADVKMNGGAKCSDIQDLAGGALVFSDSVNAANYFGNRSMQTWIQSGGRPKVVLAGNVNESLAYASEIPEFATTDEVQAIFS